jgi:AmmeMemoRadiSam system protein A
VLTETEREELLQIARGALMAELMGAGAVVPEMSEGATRPGGAFVTLHQRGRLRGCIGHLEASEPLGRVVARCAVAAARSDPRFAPVSASELPEIDIELSVLGPLERLHDVQTLEIGRHGLVVEMGMERGLLLPQVATEHGWDCATFLEQTCRKAGLSRDAWKNGAELWIFEAEVFGERSG